MKKNSLYVLILIFLAFWKLWIPETKVAVDHPFWFKETLETFFSLPFVWRELLANGLGEAVYSSIWIWPVLFLHGFFTKLGFSFEVLTHLLGTLPALLLSFLSIQKLLSFLKISGWGKYIGSFFYLTNTYFILLLDGGQLNLALSYSLLPLCFVFFKKAIEEEKSNDIFYLVILTVVVSFFDVRSLFLLAVLFTLDFILELFIKLKEFPISRYFRVALITMITLLGIHAYWIIPAVYSLSFLPSAYGQVQQLKDLSFSTFSNSLFLMHPNWFQNVFGRVFNIRAEFIVIPILVFLAPVLHRRNRWIGFWLVVALIGGFLSKGSNPPFGEVYNLLLENVPGFIAFRDSSKFYFLIAISYSVLIAFTVDKIKKSVFLLPVILIYLLFLIRPVFLEQMTGMFSTPIYQEEYESLTTVLKENQNFSRVLWLPTRAPLGFTSPLHPSVEAIYLIEKRPFASAIVGTYESLNFLREAPFMGEILSISGIGYIAYPPLDFRREDPHPDIATYYQKFLSQLKALPWITDVVIQSRVPLLKLKNQDRFFATPNTWLVIGADDLYKESTKSAKLSLKNNSLIFADETPGLTKRLIDNPEVKIVLNNKNLEDLAASLIDIESFIFPANNLKFSPDQGGWWKRETVDFLSFKDFLKQRYQIDFKDFDFGGGWAIGEGNLQFEIRDKQVIKGKLLLARVLESSQSGELKFYQNQQLIGKVSTANSGDNLRWFEIGKLTENSSLIIESKGDINVINSLAFIEEQTWNVYKKKAQEQITNGKVKTFGNDLEDENLVKVDYQVINPTKYKVFVSGIKNPVVLSFSESFDPNWEANGIKSLPLYSLINGFWIEKDGEYIVEYKLQRYSFIGFGISTITIIILIMIFLKFRKK